MLKKIQIHEWVYTFIFFYLSIMVFSYSSIIAIVFFLFPIGMLFLPQEKKVYVDTGMVMSAYFWLAYIIKAVSHARHDHFLYNLDLLLGLDKLDTFVIENQHYIITEVLSFCYLMYFVGLVFSAFYFIYYNQKYRESFSSGFFFVFWVIVLGYIFLPSEGPYFFIPHENSGHHGLFAQLNYFLYDNFANRIDCFPSGHAAESLFILFFCWMSRKKLFIALWSPICLGIIVSTIYLRFHYVSDIIAGICLAIVGITISYYKLRAKTYISEQSNVY